MTASEGRSQRASVDMGMIGSTTGDIVIRWTQRDAILYALGVGAGLDAPEQELGFTTENSQGVALRAVPTYVAALAMTARPPAFDALDSSRFLHASQRIEWSRPLAPEGKALLRSTVVEVADKGRDAIVTNAAIIQDAIDGALIAQSRSAIFVRGGGGFGGPRGSGQDWRRPARPADIRVEQVTRPEQALLYRLSGDRHPLHSDPVFARQCGFDRPILHGLCTYGMACRALVATVADGDPAQLRMMDARFRKPVWPGSRLVTEIWHEEHGPLLFRTLDDHGDVVLDRGQALLRAPG